MLTVLSPHLDDAVLSVAGALQDEPDALVVTCFAGVPEPGTPPSEWDQRCGVTDPHQHGLARREEDVAAFLALGGGRPLHLDLLDGAYREEAAEQTLRTLREALRSHVSAADAVLAPLGVGGHPDHLLVRAAALELAADAGVPLRLYADQPYALERGWPTWVLPPARRVARRVRDLARTPPDRERSWRPALLGLAVGAPQVRVLERPELRRKRTAVAAYASQVSALGGLEHTVSAYEVTYTAARSEGEETAWPGP